MRATAGRAPTSYGSHSWSWRQELNLQPSDLSINAQLLPPI